MTQRKLHLWCLIDTRSKKMVEGLLFDEARAVVSSLESTALEYWYAWRDDWVDWKRVAEVDGLSEMIFRQMVVAPPALPSDSMIVTGPQGLASMPEETQREAPEATDLADLSIIVPDEEKKEATSPGDLLENTSFTVRAKRRFKKRYKITVEIDGQTFISHSRDISVGGINLEDPVPDWVQGHFKVRIGKPNNKKQIELKCSLIRKEGEEDRHRIRIMPLQNLEDEKQLESWIAA